MRIAVRIERLVVEGAGLPRSAGGVLAALLEERLAALLAGATGEPREASFPRLVAPPLGPFATGAPASLARAAAPSLHAAVTAAAGLRRGRGRAGRGGSP